jgi:orotidine-5'-phosphate decarboxylase
MQSGLQGELSPLILALDTPDLEAGRKLADSVSTYVDVVKVGLQLYSREGSRAVQLLKKDGFEVFLDIKMNDIPNTVLSACRELCLVEPMMLTVHTMGGQEMMRAAAQEIDGYCVREGVRKPMLIGVTVLTSLDLLALKKIGVRDSVEKQVLRLAKLAAESGLDGLVTSPLEILPVRREVGPDMTLVAPGVRLAGMGKNDQKRVATPGEAVRAGADFVVVGRPLSNADNPAEVATEMLSDIGIG